MTKQDSTIEYTMVERYFFICNRFYRTAINKYSKIIASVIDLLCFSKRKKTPPNPVEKDKFGENEVKKPHDINTRSN